jgi:hypothetical protein
LVGEGVAVDTAHGNAEGTALEDIMVGEALNQLGLAASSTERATLALLLQVRQGASGIQGGLIGRVGGLCRLDASDVKAATSNESRGGLLGEQAQGAQGG